MNLFFRLLRVLFMAFASRKQTGLLDAHSLRFRVWIGDQDPMGHLTNSRYASFTDLAVMNYIARTGAMGTFRKRGWLPIIQHEAFTYHRMIRFPQSFELQTHMIGWLDQYICFRHRFISEDKLIAESRMIARIVGRRGTKVTSQMALEALGLSMESPALDPRYIEAIQDLKAKR